MLTYEFAAKGKHIVSKGLPTVSNFPEQLIMCLLLGTSTFTVLLWSDIAAVPCMLCFVCGAGDRPARRSPTKHRTSNGSFSISSQTLNSECLLVCTQEESGWWASEEKRRGRYSLRAMMGVQSQLSHLSVLVKDSMRTPGKVEDPQLDPHPAPALLLHKQTSENLLSFPA